MVEHRRFAEPDPTDYFQGRLSTAKRKLQAYAAILLSSVLCQIVMYFMIIGSRFFGRPDWSTLFARFLLTFLFVGFIAIIYYAISSFLFAYRYSKDNVDLNPISDKHDYRLQVSNGDFDEVYGVQLSTARSLFIGAVGTIVALGWMAFIPMLSEFLTTNKLFQTIFHNVGSRTTEKMTEGVVTVTGVATRTDIQRLIAILDPSDYYLIIQFLPPLVIGYVAFLHIKHLLENGSAENTGTPKMRSEMLGLAMYSRFALSKMANQVSSSQIGYTFMILVLTVLGTWWHLGLMISVFVWS